MSDEKIRELKVKEVNDLKKVRWETNKGIVCLTVLFYFLKEFEKNQHKLYKEILAENSEFKTRMKSKDKKIKRLEEKVASADKEKLLAKLEPANILAMEAVIKEKDKQMLKQQAELLKVQTKLEKKTALRKRFLDFLFGSMPSNELVSNNDFPGSNRWS